MNTIIRIYYFIAAVWLGTTVLVFPTLAEARPDGSSSFMVSVDIGRALGAMAGKRALATAIHGFHQRAGAAAAAGAAAGAAASGNTALGAAVSTASLIPVLGNLLGEGLFRLFGPPPNWLVELAERIHL